MTRPSVVLFDLDDTLFAHSAAVSAGVRAHRAAVGGAIAGADEATELARWTALEELHYHRYLRGEIGFDDQRRERMRGFVAPFGLEFSDDEALVWYWAYVEHYRAAWAIHEDAIGCLDAMPGVRFGIITNGELAFQLPKLEAIGLLPRIEHVIASGDLGVAKPDPRIFAHACNLFGVAGSDAVYVGDRFETDAVGAASAGLTGVWVDRLGVAGIGEQRVAVASGILIVPSLAEVPGVLGF